MAETFGRYELATLLGRGGMAEVYKARHVSRTGVGKQVVVKRILPGYSNLPEFRAMFLDEGRLTTQLSHGNLVQVFEAGEVGERLFLAMEWVDGVGLDKVLDRARARQVRLPPVVAVLIAIEALKGLQHAHTRLGEDGRLLRIVHRDISPDNLLVSFEGQVKVTDFGIAKAALEGRPETQSGVFKGKLMYGAPEQIRGQKVDARADVFSLGVVLHEMLSGNNPIGQRAVELALSGAPLPRVGTFFVGEELPDIVARATASRPDERYPSALAFQQALTAWMLPRAGVHATTGIAHLMAWLFPAEASARGIDTRLDRGTLAWLESNPTVEKEPEPATPFEQTSPSSPRPALETRVAPAEPAGRAPPARQPKAARPSARAIAIGLGAAAALAAGAFGALQYAARAADQQALAEAKEAFSRRQLSQATSLLSPLIHRDRPVPEAIALAAEVDAEVHPSAALSEVNRLTTEAAKAHVPPDWGAIDHLLEVASGTGHFKPELERARERVRSVYQVPVENIAAAGEAAKVRDVAKLKGLLPCPAESCSDDWYLAQVQLELDARRALDDTERLLGEQKIFEARAALAGAGRTLYQDPRREQLHQRLGVDVSEVQLEAQVRDAVDRRDFAGAAKTIDDCHADGEVCQNAERVREELEREELFDRDARHAEEQLDAGRPWVASVYLKGALDRTRWQTRRAWRLLQRTQQGSITWPPDKACDAAWKEARLAPAGAMVTLEGCVARHPESWEYLRQLGETYRAINDAGRALSTFHRYLELAPTTDEHRAEVEQRLESLSGGGRLDVRSAHQLGQQKRELR